MRLACLLILSVALALGQTPVNNLAMVGVSANPGATPIVAGTGLWARLVKADTGTYAFAVVDALPTSVQPFVVTTQVGTGIAQRLVTINGVVDLVIPTAAGISWTGTNVGWAWSSGGAAVVHWGRFRILPNVRFVKSSVSGAGYQVIAGALFGWGW